MKEFSVENKRNNRYQVASNRTVVRFFLHSSLLFSVFTHTITKL